MKENKAFYYYDQMVLNYKRWQQGGVGDRAAHGRFINAAKALAELGMSNPFKYVEMHDNAYAVPTEPGQIVTGVEEK